MNSGNFIFVSSHIKTNDITLLRC